MERVSLDDAPPDSPGDGTTRRGLSDLLETVHLAINRYRVPPGDGLPGGLHAHANQEEVFETLSGAVAVAAGEAVRFAPGEFQSGRNDAEGNLVVLAIGVPRDSEDVRIPYPYLACGHDNRRLATADGEPGLVCPACGDERVTLPCLACGGDDLRVELDGELRPVVRCRDCGAAFERPPTRDSR